MKEASNIDFNTAQPVKKKKKKKKKPSKKIKQKKILVLQKQALFIFKNDEYGTTEPKKDDHKHHAEATHVTVNHLCQRLGV